MRIHIVTIFPGMLEGFIGGSMLKRAARMGLVEFGLVNPRDFTSDPHRTTDDRPYGGGPGMVMKPAPLFDAVKSVADEEARVILMSPQGRPFTQTDARRLAEERHLVFISGHYEGVDERVRIGLADEEISIGDYVLTNGALAAAVVVDAVVRLVPGVLGCEGSAQDESFSHGMLEYPQYTRPAEYMGMKVPEVLLSGDHGEVGRWRAEQARARTMARRPDLMNGEVVSGGNG
ncbi:MAG: tRNA (guanosine(37)-N1)-methyltransferase TrmD [Lentisphaerae bacterium]|nr:tRNA (guanosine(37)-N1)-methyltransferase TrmD [Lentisphaerota bacterium]